MATVICFDTLCAGFEPVRDEFGQPVKYASEAEAQAEMDLDPEFYEDCFVCDESKIGHKAIFTGTKGD